MAQTRQTDKQKLENSEKWEYEFIYKEKNPFTQTRFRQARTNMINRIIMFIIIITLSLEIERERERERV